MARYTEYIPSISCLEGVDGGLAGPLREGDTASATWMHIIGVSIPIKL